MTCKGVFRTYSSAAACSLRSTRSLKCLSTAAYVGTTLGSPFLPTALRAARKIRRFQEGFILRRRPQAKFGKGLSFASSRWVRASPSVKAGAQRQQLLLARKAVGEPPKPGAPRRDENMQTAAVADLGRASRGLQGPELRIGERHLLVSASEASGPSARLPTTIPAIRLDTNGPGRTTPDHQVIKKPGFPGFLWCFWTV